MGRVWTRREALRAAALFAPLAVGLVAVAKTGRAAPIPRASTGAGAGAGVLDLPAGTAIGRCTLVAVGPVVHGGVAVTLRAPGGASFHVDVLAHDPETPGVARAGSLGVYVENGGAGDKRTDEEQGLGAMALARVLARRVASGMRVPALLTLRQRAPQMAGPVPERA